MKYNLVGIDGNAFSIIGYVANAMQKEKCSSEDINKYKEDAMSSDYNHLLSISVDMINKLNMNTISSYAVVLEFLNTIGEVLDYTVLDMNPTSFDEAMKMAEDYTITNGEQMVVWSCDEDFTILDRTIVKTK